MTTALLQLVWLRLSEQPAKLLYLAATLAAVIFAWIVLSAFASPSLLPTSSAIEARLVIGNGRAKNTVFPVRHIPRIQQISGIGNLYWSTAAAFFCADGSKTTVTVHGWDGDYDAELRTKGASDMDIATWHATENGVLVSPEAARRCGLAAGTTVSPNNIYGNGELPLYVVAILPEQKAHHNFMVHAHYSYLNRMMDGHLGTARRDAVVGAIASIKDISRLDQIAQAIEQEFQSSDPPLEVRVIGDANSLLGRFGQVKALLILIMGALAVCLFLVFIAITIHLLAQRRVSMAILQTLGFNGRIQFFGLALELTGVMMAGAVLGVAAGYGALMLLTPWAVNTMHIMAPRPIDGAILIVLPALLLLLVSTLIWPAMQIARLRPVDHLKT